LIETAPVHSGSSSVQRRRSLRLIGWHTELKLLFEAFGDTSSQRCERRAVEQIVSAPRPLEQLHIVFRRAMHADRHAAGAVFAAPGEPFDLVGELPPTAQVQIADAEGARAGAR
jgi:hypothetical protein